MASFLYIVASAWLAVATATCPASHPHKGVDDHCYRVTEYLNNSEAINLCNQPGEISIAKGGWVDVVIALNAVKSVVNFMWLETDYHTGADRYSWVGSSDYLKKNGTTGTDNVKSAAKPGVPSDWCVEAKAIDGGANIPPKLKVFQCSNNCPNICKLVQNCPEGYTFIDDGQSKECVIKSGNVKYDDAGSTCPPGDEAILHDFAEVDRVARALGANFLWTNGYVSQNSGCNDAVTSSNAAKERFCWEYGQSSDIVYKNPTSNKLLFKVPGDSAPTNKSCIEYKYNSGNPIMKKHNCAALCPIACGQDTLPPSMSQPPIEVWNLP